MAPHKLDSPTLRPDVVERPRLATLLRDTACRVVLLVAGAGYGKTTLIRQWQDADPRPAAWLQLDRSDNDPVTFLRAVVASFDRLSPLPAVVAASLENHTELVARVLPQLERELCDRSEPVLLVVDDIHVLTDRGAAELFEEVVDLLPAGSQAVVAGRTVSNVRSERRRINGQLLDLGPSDLAFTQAESIELLERALSDADDALVELVSRRAEGWAAGLQLAVLALRDGDSSAWSTLGELPDPFRAASYLHQEFLHGLAEADRRFLLRTAVVEPLTGEICDFVLQESDSAAHLESLAASGNAFVTTLGEAGRYRYHPLFVDLLLAELRSKDSTEERALRRRMIQWFEAHGDSSRAVEQALVIGDSDLVAQVVFRQLFPVLSRGEMASLTRWLDDIPAAEVRSNPYLAVSAGWHALVTGRGADLEQWLRIADSGTANRSDEQPSDLDVGLAALKMIAGTGGAKQAAEHARVVHDAGPAASHWWALSGMKRALWMHFAGVEPDLQEALEPAEFESRGVPIAHSVTLAHLGFDALKSGRSHGQRLIASAMHEVVDAGLGEYHMVAMVHCADAYAAAHQGSILRSEVASEQALRLLETTADVANLQQVHLRLVLADAAFLRSDTDEAARHVTEADRRLPAESDAVVLHDWIDTLSARIQNRRTHPGVSGLTAAERGVLEQLRTHRSLAEIGEHLFVSRNTVKSHTVSIYRKLQVPGRSAAVDLAQDLQLFDRTSAAPSS